MQARSLLLLRRDWHYISSEEDNLRARGVSLRPSENLLDWTADIAALDGSIYAGGVFQVRVSYALDYDARPPSVQFLSIPFHPGIAADDGRPCIMWLESMAQWQALVRVLGAAPRLDVLLVHLQLLLSNPRDFLESPLNPEAAGMLQRSPEQFRAIAEQCVAASTRMQQGLPPFVSMPPPDPFAGSTQRFQKITPLPPPSPPSLPRATAVDFDDYFRDWLVAGAAADQPLLALTRPPPTGATRDGDDDDHLMEWCARLPSAGDTLGDSF